MKTILASLAVSACFLGIATEPGKAGPSKNADGQKETSKLHEDATADDPLPVGSTVRFGTSRFRHGSPINQLALSADGKIAVVSDLPGSMFTGNSPSSSKGSRVFDLTSGREICVLAPLDHSSDEIEAVAITPDGKMVISKQDDVLHIYDSSTGKELRKCELPGSRRNVVYQLLAVTPDSKAVAVAGGGSVVHLIDLKTGESIQNYSHTADVAGMTFSPDGKLMATFGGERQIRGLQGKSFVRILDVKTGKELHQTTLGNVRGITFLTFSPDSKKLVSGAPLRTWDVETGKEISGYPESVNGCTSAAFAPDGKVMAVTSYDGIQVYDIASKKRQFHINDSAIGLQFTDGGKTLTGAVRGVIVRWDAKTGKVLTPEAAGESEIAQILITNDGKRVITRGLYGDVHLWDGSNGKHLKGFEHAEQGGRSPFGDSPPGVAMSPDIKFLAWAVEDNRIMYKDDGPFKMQSTGSRIRLYDIAKDKYIDRWTGFKGDAHNLAFTLDGKKLVTVDHYHGMVRLWNVETGKEERSFPIMTPAQRQTDQISRTMLSPDCRMLAVVFEASPFGPGMDNGRRRVKLWDVASGKEHADLYGHVSEVLDMAFSPDGRFLATAGELAMVPAPTPRGGEVKSNSQVFIWDTATGKRVETLPAGFPASACAVSFSRDGRFLATALPNGGIQVWELDTWSVWNEFKQSHRDRPSALTFTLGGQLFSGSHDTTALAWDIRPPRTTAGSLETAWTDLAKDESGEAFKAEGRFAGAGADAMKFFAERIKPTGPPDALRIQRWIADLDHARYPVRESASSHLIDVGRHARPYLEEALNSFPSPEVEDRARKILALPMKMSPKELREFRAVLVLELINDDEAKNLLKTWASGFKGAVLTQESKAAIHRMEGVAMAKRW